MLFILTNLICVYLWTKINLIGDKNDDYSLSPLLFLISFDLENIIFSCVINNFRIIIPNFFITT